jgi:hypothetical protein
MGCLKKQLLTKHIFLMSQRIFKDVSLLIGVRMSTINQGMIDIKDFLDNNNIPLTTPIGGDSKDNIGDALINTLAALDQFLREYKELKETWCLTNT